MENYKYFDVTEKILKAFFNVYNKLGYGFLERVYENAMLIELERLGLFCENQSTIRVYYDNIRVGDYYADIIVEEKVILELKAVENLGSHHEVQLVNYLKATEIELGLLLNFGSKPQFKRRVLTNKYKKELDADSYDFYDEL